MKKELYDNLQNIWGYNEFKENQLEIIESVLKGFDTIALLPTGGGKSICFQLPALLSQGLCLVVSPLLALMKDQVQRLNSLGVRGAFISSEMSELEIRNLFEAIVNQEIKILYISPERLNSQMFLEFISNIKISFIAIDEAHCISEWGNDFRPSYQNIQLLRDIFPKIGFLALTATATPQVIQNIQLKLKLKNPKLFKSTFNRPKFHIQCLEVEDKHLRLLNELRFRKESGIIYVRTRREAEFVVGFLHQHQVKNVAFYHAGLPFDQKNQLQNFWNERHDFVLVSTNAFGMGIDKANVRFVIHFSAPNSIENYYQEIGRAGRDGVAAYALTLWNHAELSNLDDQLSDQVSSKLEFEKAVSLLFSSVGIANYDQNYDWFELSVQNLIKNAGFSRKKLKSITDFLHQQQILILKDKLSKSQIELMIRLEDLEFLPRSHSYFIEKLVRFLPAMGSGQVYFHHQKLVELFNVEWKLIEMQLRDMERLNYLRFLDGSQVLIKFLITRNDRDVVNVYWPLYKEIQTNKIRKWEEMKYFLKNTDDCRMRMILAYFGEKTKQNCMYCDYCKREYPHTGLDLQLLKILNSHALGLDELSVLLNSFERTDIYNELCLLLDTHKIKMLDFKTYMIK